MPPAQPSLRGSPAAEPAPAGLSPAACCRRCQASGSVLPFAFFAPRLALSWAPAHSIPPPACRAAAEGRFSLLPGTASAYHTAHSPPPVRTPAGLSPVLHPPTLMTRTSYPIVPQRRDCPKLTATTGHHRPQRLAGASSSVSKRGRHRSGAVPGSTGAGRDGPGPA